MPRQKTQTPHIRVIEIPEFNTTEPVGRATLLPDTWNFSPDPPQPGNGVLAPAGRAWTPQRVKGGAVVEVFQKWLMAYLCGYIQDGRQLWSWVPEWDLEILVPEVEVTDDATE